MHIAYIKVYLFAHFKLIEMREKIYARLCNNPEVTASKQHDTVMIASGSSWFLIDIHGDVSLIDPQKI